jgi:hypothetical protein
MAGAGRPGGGGYLGVLARSAFKGRLLLARPLKMGLGPPRELPLPRDPPAGTGKRLRPARLQLNLKLRPPGGGGMASSSIMIRLRVSWYFPASAPL